MNPRLGAGLPRSDLVLVRESWLLRRLPGKQIALLGESSLLPPFTSIYITLIVMEEHSEMLLYEGPVMEEHLGMLLHDWTLCNFSNLRILDFAPVYRVRIWS